MAGVRRDLGLAVRADLDTLAGEGRYRTGRPKWLGTLMKGVSELMASRDTKVERRRLLRQRGLIPPAPVQIAKTERDPRKTPLMLVLEDAYGKPIQELLYEGTLQELADKWHVDESTVCKWRAKFDGNTVSA